MVIIPDISDLSWLNIIQRLQPVRPSSHQLLWALTLVYSTSESGRKKVKTCRETDAKIMNVGVYTRIQHGVELTEHL